MAEAPAAHAVVAAGADGEHRQARADLEHRQIHAGREARQTDPEDRVGREAREPGVLHCGELGLAPLVAVTARFDVEIVALPPDADITGTYWGAPEAGLVGSRLFVRADTPVHSALHELCHYVCMTPRRRAALDTDAGGSVIEECAVCYLQLTLAAGIEGFGLDRGIADMDAWGYSFREGSATAWLHGDGRDARAWLQQRGLVDPAGRPTWRLRGEVSAIGESRRGAN